MASTRYQLSRHADTGLTAREGPSSLPGSGVLCHPVIRSTEQDRWWPSACSSPWWSTAWTPDAGAGAAEHLEGAAALDASWPARSARTRCSAWASAAARPAGSPIASAACASSGGPSSSSRVCTGVIAFCSTYWQIAVMRFVSGFGHRRALQHRHAARRRVRADAHSHHRARRRCRPAGRSATWSPRCSSAYLLPHSAGGRCSCARSFPGSWRWCCCGACPIRRAGTRRAPQRRAARPPTGAFAAICGAIRSCGARSCCGSLTVDRAAVRLLRREHLAAQLSGEGSRRQPAEHGLVRRRHLRDDGASARSSPATSADIFGRARDVGRRPACSTAVYLPILIYAATPDERAVSAARVRLPLRRAVCRQRHLPERELPGERPRHGRRHVVQPRPHRLDAVAAPDRHGGHATIRSASASGCSASPTRSARSFPACS